MWAAEQRARHTGSTPKDRKGCRSDISDQEWKLVEPLLPGVARTGRPRKAELRQVINALRYLVRSGCEWLDKAAYLDFTTATGADRVSSTTAPLGRRAHICMADALPPSRSRLRATPRRIHRHDLPHAWLNVIAPNSFPLSFFKPSLRRNMLAYQLRYLEYSHG